MSSEQAGKAEVSGKKIFFLHPTALIQNEVAAELIQQEYEVYVTKNHGNLRKVLKRYPNSVVFVTLDEGMQEKDWETWIGGIMNTPETSSTAIGIISANDSEALQRKYINNLKVSCGYTVLKHDLSASIRQIHENLRTVDAKGRRKYMRAATETETATTANLPLNGTYVTGSIRDISVVGFSCSFDHDPELVKNTLFKDIQLRLQSTLLKAEGIVFGSRMDGLGKIYVILFTQRIDPEVKMKIRKYIQHNLQSKMDLELK